MQRISSISFKGAEQIFPEKKETTLTSNPISTDLGEKALPICDKSLAINPSLPSEFLGDADIARYKTVQRDWAEGLAKRLKIPVENIMARLPEIKLGDPKTMIGIGQFNPIGNVIEITPVREIANLCGNDESKIIHETTHGLFHNLRRAYVKQFTPEQLQQSLVDIVETKMLQGEHGLIIKEFLAGNVNGQTIYTPELMTAPLLSAKERTALINTLNSLSMEHLDLNTAKLNDAGKGVVREMLLPQLTDYSKQIIVEPEKRDDKICEKMTDYLDSFFTRKSLLINNLTSPIIVDSEKNLQTPLTQTEQNMAKNNLDGLLSTHEGNYMVQQDSSGILDNSSKSYFMSYEEVLARKEESIYRLAKVNQKIKDIKNTGIKPSEFLLKEKQTAINNLKLLKLTKELDKVEKKIIGSEKNTEKIIEINKLKQEMQEMQENAHNNEKFNDISKHIDFNEFKFIVQNEETIIKMIEEKIPQGLREDCTKILGASKKIGLLLPKLNELNSPEKLLTDTSENNALKTQFDNLMTKIREISSECDLADVPKQFFKNESEYLKANEKLIQVMQKWAKRIL